MKSIALVCTPVCHLEISTFGNSRRVKRLNHFIPTQVIRGLNRKLAGLMAEISNVLVPAGQHNPEDRGDFMPRSQSFWLYAPLSNFQKNVQGSRLQLCILFSLYIHELTTSSSLKALPSHHSSTSTFFFYFADTHAASLFIYKGQLLLQIPMAHLPL